jgi:peptide-methionine (S)-S-oxide reductase
MKLVHFILLAAIAIPPLFTAEKNKASASEKRTQIMKEKPSNYPTAILAGGCFWCIESEFRALEGVLYTRSGYIGGHIENPKYEDTHNSKSGHAEAVEITYDPKIISYEDLIYHFLKNAHDPTQLNRQGPDIGTQYRSAIFYLDDEQKRIAKNAINTLTQKKLYNTPIVTTLEPATTFWEAENYHQQYYEKYEEKYGRPHINDWIKREKRKAHKSKE